jgi:methyl-accepting chemotaxis protein
MPEYLVEIIAIIVSVIISFITLKMSANKDKQKQEESLAVWKEKVDSSIQRLYEKIRDIRPDVEKIRSVQPMIVEISESLDDVVDTQKNISIMAGKHSVRIDKIDEKIVEIKCDYNEKINDVKNSVKDVNDDIKQLNREHKK